MRGTQTENLAGDRVGFVNHVFSYFYRLRLVGKSVKAKSRARTTRLLDGSILSDFRW
jgi:aspartyl/asparaginyl beta-hydroxylase (cupin superfamily)